MPTVARRITVVVDGSSSELEAALSKAADALKELGAVVAKQTRASVDASNMTVKANEQVATSYQRTAEAVKTSQLQVVESVQTQIAAQREAAAAATKASEEAVAAGESQATGAKRTAEEVASSAAQEKAAYGETGAAATKSADEQLRAGERAATGARTGSTAAKTSAAESGAAFAASGGALTKLGKTTVLTAAAVAAGSLYMSQRFESATTKIMTQAGASKKQTEVLRKGILDMAGSLGESPDHLAEGMYHIVSSMNVVLPATTRTSEELRILRIAAEGARIGGSSLEETTYALASAMNVLHQHAGDAQGTMGLLNAVVGSGDMTMSDLLASLKSGLIPTAQTFGVSLRSVGAALATMGDEGMKGALAGTRLRMTLSLLAAPSAKAAEMLDAIGMSGGQVRARTTEMTKALQEAGLSTTTMADDLKKPDGIQVALQDLKTHLEDSGLSADNAAAVMSRAFGGGRTGATVMLLEQGLGRVNAKYEQIGTTVKAFAPDWQQTQETLKQQADDMGASIESLAVKIGKDETPAAEALLRDLRETADWFDHNTVAAEALAAVVGGVLTVAVGAFAANKLAKVVEGLKQMQAASAWLRNGFTAPAAAGAARAETSAASATAAGPLGALEGKGLVIGSSRSGAGLPGSMTAPIVVAIEAGQYAGLGGESAAGTAIAGTQGEVKAAESKVAPAAESAAQADSGSMLFNSAGKPRPTGSGSSSFGEPLTAPTAAAGEEAAIASRASAGAMTAVKSGMGKLLDGMLKGGMIAAIGTLGSQAVGSAIGGKTGKTVSSIGSDTAIGAAIGTVIEPGIGTAIGGALGGVAGLIKHLEGGTQGQHAAETAGAGTSPTVKNALQVGIDNANKVASKAIYSIEHQHQEFGEEAQHWFHDHTFGIIGNPEGNSGPNTGAEKRAVEEQRRSQLFSVGKQFGASHIQEQLSTTSGMSSVAALTGVINDTEKRFKGLPLAAQQGAMESIVAMVHTYQQQGKLPPTAVEELVRSVEQKFPALKQAFSGAGTESVAALNNALKGQNVLGSIEVLVNQWRNVFPQLPHIVGLNMASAEQTFATTMAKLTVLAHTGPESQRAAASALYKRMHDEEIGYFATMRTGIEGEIKTLSSKLGPETRAGTVAMQTAYSRLVSTIRQEMAGGVLETEKGTRQINKILNKELGELGISNSTKTQKKSGKFGPGPGSGANPLQETGAGGSSGFQGLARGGMLQVGRPGQPGHDSVPMHVAGHNIVTAPGETVAVFTRQQRAQADRGIPGGLAGVFANRTPNYRPMATGGFVAGPGTNYSVGEEPKIAADLKRLGEYLHVMLEGISGYRSPSHSVAVGGFTDDPHTRGEASDTIGTQTIPASVLARFGLERPFPGASEADHMQLLGSLAHPGHSLPAGSGGGGVMGAIAQTVAAITAPAVSGSGLIPDIVRGALEKVTSAANAKLGTAQNSGAGGSSLGGGFTGAWTQVMAQIAARKHWSLPDWKSVVSLESGGNPNSVNPSSGAQGLGQALGATKTQFPKMVSRNPSQQIEGMAEYIASRYGNPTAALAHEHSDHWYDEGGWIEAAGGFDSAGTPSSSKTKTKVNKGSKVTPKNRGGGPRTPNPQTLISRIGKIPDTENVRRLAAFTPILGGLENERSLLSKILGAPDHSFVMPGDMAELQPTLAAGQRIHPWMTTTEGLRDNQAAIVRAGATENPQLTLQKELLTYYTELPSHHLLTPSDVGILSGAGVTDPSLKPYNSIYGPIENTMEWQINKASDLVVHEEQEMAKWQALSAQYRDRQAKIHAHAEREMHRYEKIKASIATLTTGSLQARVKAAESRDHTNELKADATASQSAIAENIASERELPAKDQNKKILAEWQAEKTRIESYSRSLEKPLSGTSAAKIALRKNQLKNELPPIETNLRELAGSSTSVGTGGRFGTLGGYSKVLNEGVTKLLGEVGTQKGSTIPGLQVELMQQRAEDVDAGLKPAPTIAAAAAPGENAALTQALKEQDEVLGRTVALQAAQFSTLSNFIPEIPRYDVGGLVANTGLALVHAGEWISPSPKGPYGSQLAGQAPVVHLHHETHVHGNARGLIETIDNRVQHAGNVKGVSQQIARRGQGLSGRRRV